MSDQLNLGFGFSFEDLYDRDALVRLDAEFRSYIGEKSLSMIEMAPYLEDFIGELFGIGPELRALQARHHALAPLYSVKRRFVQRRALTGQTAEKAIAIDGNALAAELEALFMAPLTELTYAEHVARWLDAEAEHTRPLGIAAQYAVWATLFTGR